MSDTAIVTSDIMQPVFADPKAIKEAFAIFHNAMATILTTDDVVKIQNKTFVKKSGWVKLAMYFGVSTKTVSQRREELGEGHYLWTVTVEAKKGNYAVSRSAACSSKEKDHMNGGKTENRKEADVFASAETRAAGRALSAFFGSGAVSYEEIEGSEHEFQKQKNLVYCKCNPPAVKFAKDVTTNHHHCANCSLPVEPSQAEKILKASKN